ncbi:triacylglycerol lipase [Dorcoceras hygrometricum]|uniref:Triacylglycerol lipase n=1 Tax=Dorcoceras hygrometricum TaxID=472368 RepID=A0A2Z7ASW7_9LAMI|nr:triacylglycerol lipase [Dorcoceras hygrometricum]
MSLFDLQDVCIAIGSLATLDLPMVVDLIGIYGLKGPYCTLTTTNWFLQALSVIPRGSWGDVARCSYHDPMGKSGSDSGAAMVVGPRLADLGEYRMEPVQTPQFGFTGHSYNQWVVNLPPSLGKAIHDRFHDRGLDLAPKDQVPDGRCGRRSIGDRKVERKCYVEAVRVEQKPAKARTHDHPRTREYGSVNMVDEDFQLSIEEEEEEVDLIPVGEPRRIRITPPDEAAEEQKWAGAWLRPVSRGNRHFTVGGGRLRQSGPRPKWRLLRQPALEGLTRSARTDSPRQVGRNKFRRLRRRRREERKGGGGLFERLGLGLIMIVVYGPFNPYIPIRSTTIGKSRVAIDPTAMHTSWRSNSDITSVTRVSMTFRVVRTNQYNQDLGLIHSTNGNHLESPNEGSSIDHQVTIYLHAQNITMLPTNETWYFASQILVSSSDGLILILTAQSTRN